MAEEYTLKVGAEGRRHLGILLREPTYGNKQGALIAYNLLLQLGYHRATLAKATDWDETEDNWDIYVPEFDLNHPDYSPEVSG